MDIITVIISYGLQLIRNKLYCCLLNNNHEILMWVCRPAGPLPSLPLTLLSPIWQLLLLVALDVTPEPIKCADIWSEERHMGIFSKKGKESLPYLPPPHTCTESCPLRNTIALPVHILWPRWKQLTGNTDNSDSKLHGAHLIACLDSLIPMQLALENTNLYGEALEDFKSGVRARVSWVH